MSFPGGGGQFAVFHLMAEDFLGGPWSPNELVRHGVFYNRTGREGVFD